MMLLVCQDCTTAFAVGLDRCPHCGSTDYVPQGEEMPKSTKARGATNAATGLTGTAAEGAQVEPETPVADEPAKATKKTTKKTTKKA